MIDTYRLIARRRLQDSVFNVLGIVCMLLGVVTLAALLFDLAVTGWTRIDRTFLTSFPDRASRILF